MTTEPGAPKRVSLTRIMPSPSARALGAAKRTDINIIATAASIARARRMFIFSAVVTGIYRSSILMVWRERAQGA